ncbi:DUF4253 domain-containing protein [Streptomyces rubiginosohelvolus]|uniref:DUF4253 domain-containing protein n=1 Tax=Streptomyces rubiginosohelvolus TaxID=67362 RepID=UPI003696164E
MPTRTSGASGRTTRGRLSGSGPVSRCRPRSWRTLTCARGTWRLLSPVKAVPGGLALVQVARGADAPAALSWRGATHHMTAQGLSAVLRSWEHRSGVRVVGVGHGALYLSVAAPPTEAHQARVLAAERHLVCPDVFHEDPDLDWSTYHEELMRLREWRFWWD